MSNQTEGQDNKILESILKLKFAMSYGMLLSSIYDIFIMETLSYGSNGCTFRAFMNSSVS